MNIYSVYIYSILIDYNKHITVWHTEVPYLRRVAMLSSFLHLAVAWWIDVVSMDPWMPRNEQKKDGLKRTSMVNNHK